MYISPCLSSSSRSTSHTSLQQLQLDSATVCSNRLVTAPWSSLGGSLGQRRALIHVTAPLRTPLLIHLCSRETLPRAPSLCKKRISSALSLPCPHSPYSSTSLRMRAWIYAACFLSVVSATSRGQGESPTASSSRKNERKPRPRIDRSSTQLSPYYHAAFQRIASVHRPYYNLETGSRSGESQYKYSAKKDFPAIQDLQSQEKTLADRRKSQLFGLAHGLCE